MRKEGLLAPWGTSCTSLLLPGLESEEEKPLISLQPHMSFGPQGVNKSTGLSAPQPFLWPCVVLGVALLL